MVKNFLMDEYGLKNPDAFIARSATEDDLELWVDRDKETKSMQDILQRAKNNTKYNEMAMIVGDYGMGKTLSLLKIKELSKEMNAYAIYINIKPEEKINNPGLNFIQRIFRNINFSDIKIKPNDIEKLKSEYPEVGKIFENIFIGKNNTNSLSEDKKSISIAFLKGEITLSQKQRMELGIIGKMDNIEKAREYLIGLLYIMNKAKLSPLVLAIDEFEYLFSTASKSNQHLYLAILRQLFDIRVSIPKSIRDDVTNMAIFIATSEDGKRRFEERKNVAGPITPLSQRVSKIIYLQPLDKTSIKKLIEKALSLNRITGKYEEKPLIPYTDDFVTCIFEISKGVPRKIIELCDDVLRKGIEMKVAKLDSKFAKDVFSGI